MTRSFVSHEIMVTSDSKMLILFCLNIFLATAVSGRKAFELVRFETCRDLENLPLIFRGLKKHDYSKTNRSIEITMDLKKQIDSMWAKVDLFKCDTDGRPDSCEYFVKDFKINDICQKIGQKGQVWTSFVEGIQPSLECPVKPAEYKVNAPIGQNIFKFFPVPTGLWKTKGFMYQNDEVLTCVNFELKVIEIRRN